MHFVIATDGRLAAETAGLVAGLAGPDDTIEVLTVVTVPRKLVSSLRPRVEPTANPIGHSTAYLGVTGQGGFDAMATDSSVDDWTGDHEVIDGYVTEQAQDAQQPLLTALGERGLEATSSCISGERVVPAILRHLESTGCGILVVGQHRGMLPGYLGHTPQRLVSEAPCPVMVVPIG